MLRPFAHPVACCQILFRVVAQSLKRVILLVPGRLTTPNIVGSCCFRLHVALRCIVGKLQPISLCNPCRLSVRGPNNVGRAVQTDPTLLRYASAITEQKKCWELLAEKFDRFQTLRNNTQQHPTTCNRVCKRTQHVTSNNVGSVCTGLKVDLVLIQASFALLWKLSLKNAS